MTTTEYYGREVCDGDKLPVGPQVHHPRGSVSSARDSKELVSPNWHKLSLLTMTNLSVVQGLQFGCLTGNDSSASLGGFPEIKHLL